MLVRYDPFHTFDRPAPRRSWMPMDAVRHDQNVELRFDLPGVSPESIDVEVERNVLTVRAERSWAPAEGAEVLVRERAQGAVTRQVTLGESLDTDRLEASYDAGVLTLTIPVAEQAKPRKVEIHVGAPEPIEAGATN
jgi:HSP20 family protein